MVPYYSNQIFQIMTERNLQNSEVEIVKNLENTFSLLVNSSFLEFRQRIRQPK